MNDVPSGASAEGQRKLRRAVVEEQRMRPPPRSVPSVGGRRHGGSRRTAGSPMEVTRVLGAARTRPARCLPQLRERLGAAHDVQVLIEHTDLVQIAAAVKRGAILRLLLRCLRATAQRDRQLAPKLGTAEVHARKVQRAGEPLVEVLDGEVATGSGREFRSVGREVGALALTKKPGLRGEAVHIGVQKIFGAAERHQRSRGRLDKVALRRRLHVFRQRRTPLVWPFSVENSRVSTFQAFSCAC